MVTMTGLSASAGSGVLAFTVISRNELPAAKVLAATYLDHHPGHSFVTVVVEPLVEWTASRGRVVDAATWLGLSASEYLSLATSFGPAALIEVLKPLALRRALRAAEVALMLDPDIRVLSSFADVTESARDAALVLTPRQLAAVPRDDLEPRPDEQAELVFDGFVAVGQSAAASVDEWIEEDRQAVHPIGSTRWVRRALGRLDGTLVRDPGLGVGYWNLHERGRVDAARFAVLRGYDPQRPWLLSAHCPGRPRVLLSEHPTVAGWCDAQRADLLAAAPTAAPEYGYSRMADGSALSAPMRWVHRQAVLTADATGQPPHAFGEDGGESFRRWLAEPDGACAAELGLSRLALAVWTHTPTVRAAHPHPLGADGDSFRRWCTTKTGRKQLPAWAAPTPRPVHPAPSPEFGVNLAGYLRTEVGIGEMARIIARALREADVPRRVLAEQNDATATYGNTIEAEHHDDAARFPISILAINHDHMETFLCRHPGLGAGRYRIGVWAWELETFPAQLAYRFNLVDEVWTISEFCRRALAPVSPVPVKVLPMPVEIPAGGGRPVRAAGDVVQFLFCFDFNSNAERKNPWGAVEAFRRAFPDRDDVRLVIKAMTGKRYLAQRERLLQAIGGDSRVELLERFLTTEDFDALYAQSHVYVSLHRSEGFGLTVAEAMARGMAVIATDYSATTEFFDSTTGWPIPYRMVPVGPNAAPYPADSQWADPDLDAAAAAMVQVANDPTEAARRGEQARRRMAARSADSGAAWVAEQVAAAHARWLAAPPAADQSTQAKRPGVRQVKPTLAAVQSRLRQAVKR